MLLHIFHILPLGQTLQLVYYMLYVDFKWNIEACDKEYFECLESKCAFAVSRSCCKY